MDLGSWTIPEAVNWIASRRLDRVDSHATGTDVPDSKGNGEDLDNAKEQLRTALCAGTIAATASRANGVEQIASGDWGTRDDLLEDMAALGANPGTVTVPRSRVIALWPVPSKAGRKKGQTNWDTSPFYAEYRRMLEAHGKPSRHNVKGWGSLAEAADTVLDAVSDGILRDGVEAPDGRTLRRWASMWMVQWETEGCPGSWRDA